MSLDNIQHRGPDASGSVYLADRKLWLGHTRLSILDTSAAGNQPMKSTDSSIWIVYNGEIYNHLSLRNAIGESDWRTTSDTETVIYGFKKWGTGLFNRLDGMFAFILYDEKHKIIYAVRDRHGIKPLYYQKKGHSWKFSSEIRPLYDSSSIRIAPLSLAGFLRHGVFLDRYLPGSGIQTVKPGSFLQIELSGIFKTSEFVVPPASVYTRKDDPEAGVRKRLEDAVEKHLISDVPVACFLSGGLDSSVVTALAARSLGNKLLTFSIGFPDKKFDETEIAETVATRYGTDHHRIELTEDEILWTIPEAVEAMDLPSVDAINTYLVAKAVSKEGIKVAMSGLGSDELFGGYPSFKDVRWLRGLSKWMPLLRPLFERSGSQRLKRLADIPENGSIGDLAHWRRFFWTDSELNAIGMPSPGFPFEDSRDLNGDEFGQVSWAELTGYMRHMLLRDADQMSMAVSLEIRVPFLDNQLVHYVLSLPEKVKVNHHLKKGLLVDACRDLLPEEVYMRPKRGFELPMDVWLRDPLKNFAEEGLSELCVKIPILREVVQKFSRAFEHRHLHWTRLWTLVVLGHYLKNTDLSVILGDS